MPRKPRLEVPGVLYHVISRGNARQKIFLSNRDFQRYLSYLAHYQHRDRFRLFAYVLMPNHVHLLVETSDVPLSRTMQRLNSRYSQVFNRVHGRVGHVLQGRYHAWLCEKDTYLLALTRYLHLNPVRAKIAQDPADYPWSSYGAYRGQSSPVAVESAEVLRQFSDRLQTARQRYRQFVGKALTAGHEPAYYAGVEGRVLGSDDFVARVRRTEPEIPTERRTVSIDHVITLVARHFGQTPATLCGPGKQRARIQVRDWLAYVTSRHTTAGLSTVAKALSVDPSCMSRGIQRVEARLASPEGHSTLAMLLTLLDQPATLSNRKSQA
ncbi:MAG: transposase [Nitrospirae bacterium]|nr:transposase [Nitrospirota bacterium]